MIAKTTRRTLASISLCAALSWGCASHEMLRGERPLPAEAEPESQGFRAFESRDARSRKDLLPAGLRESIERRIAQSLGSKRAGASEPSERERARRLAVALDSPRGSAPAAWSEAPRPRPQTSHVPGTVRTSSTRVYYIGDLLQTPRSYRAPRFDLAPSGGLAAYDEELEEGAPIISATLLEELIRSTIDPDSWDEEGNSILIQGDKLIITRR